MSTEIHTHDEHAIERARTVRDGDAIDEQRLLEYLQSKLPGLDRPQVLQFPKGHSNLTYLLIGTGVQYVLRRPPKGANIPTGHDMEREYRILSALRPHWPKVPRPLHFCTDLNVIGAPFYVMERVDGVILRGSDHRQIELTPAYMAQACHTLIATLAEIHALDVDTMGLGNLGRPAGYIERQLTGWHRRYQKAQTDDVPDVERIVQWLVSHQPTETRATLIHNDYKYDNCVLDPNDPTKALAVLDWEMCTVGCPLMDLGTTLAYWIEAADPAPMKMMPFGPTMLPGNLTRDGVVHLYEKISHRAVAAPVFYYVYGLFKVIGIAQQIYHRYTQGLSSDPRFAMMIEAVKLLGQQGCRAIEKGRLSSL